MSITIAVDSTVLLSLGDSDKQTAALIQTMCSCRFKVICTNTPLINLAACHLQDLGIKDPDLKKAAGKALRGRLSTWGIEDKLVEGAWSGVVEEVAKKLMEDFDLGFHNALTIAEASRSKADILLTWEKDIRKCAPSTLLLALKEMDFDALNIMSPGELGQAIAAGAD